MPNFKRYIGIDYSGAETIESHLTGLRCYAGDAEFGPLEVKPLHGKSHYWSRAALAEWLKNTLIEGISTLVGIDHGFSFPIAYFEKYRLPLDWEHFLSDFHYHWPTDEPHCYVDFIRDGIVGQGAGRQGNAKWRRLVEQHCGAKSVFHFDVPGSVAKSTFAGLPWLLSLRKELGNQLHFWPFDGWQLPQDRSVIFEAYPALWSRTYEKKNRTNDQHDAYSIVRWLLEADKSDKLNEAFSPDLSAEQRQIANIEGWIPGVLKR
jgi:hypothetical protein